MDQRPGRIRFTTGEFSKLTGIPKQTLQFYDKIGIFSPAIRLDNGYRYYEAEQYEAIDIIYSLKETGMPLAEIKRYLDTRTPEICLELMDRELEHINEKIRSLERMKIVIEQKKVTTLKGIHTEPSSRTMFREIPESHLFTWDFTGIRMEDFMTELIRMMNWCYDNGYYSGHAMGSILSAQDLDRQSFDKVSHMFTTIDHAVDHPNYRHRPAGIYAVYNYKGSYEELPLVYDGILEDIRSEGWRIAGDSYENGLLDAFTQRDPSDYLIEIIIPVEKA